MSDRATAGTRHSGLRAMNGFLSLVVLPLISTVQNAFNLAAIPVLASYIWTIIAIFMSAQV